MLAVLAASALPARAGAGAPRPSAAAPVIDPLARMPAAVHVGLTDEVPGGRYGLPVPPGAVSASNLRAPHHDYPASDLMVPAGTPVLAAASGRAVVHRGERCGVGVTVRGDDGYRYVSCHLSVASVPSGSRVAAGDVLGLSGDSGNARGVPHLHFQLADPGGRPVCPQPLLVAWAGGEDRGPERVPRSTRCSFPRSSARG